MIRKFAAAAAACLVCSTGHCVDGVAVEAGGGDDRTKVLRVQITDHWRKWRPPDDEWRFAGYWELSAGVWDNPEETAADFGITPVLRIQHGPAYFEAAIGLHLVSTQVSASRKFSTSFQFGDHLGFGVRMGPDGRYDVGVRIQHLSNGGLRDPNPGINFVLMRLQYSLE